METTRKRRRKLIRTVVLSVISLLLLGRFLVPGTRRRKTLLKIENETVPDGGALIFEREKIALIKENQDVYALDLTCTHLGCTVNAAAGGFSCPCHGSRFTPRGEVAEGPAAEPLKRHDVEKQGKNFFVYLTE